MAREESFTLNALGESIWGNLGVLRRYARRVIVEQDESLLVIQGLMADLMEDYLRQGKALTLTERDLAVLLYKGTLD